MSNNAVSGKVAAEYFTADSVWRKLTAFFGRDCFVEVWVEFFTDGCDRLDSHLVQYVVDLLADQRDAIVKLLKSLAFFIRQMLSGIQRPLQIIQGRQHQQRDVAD